MNWMKRHEDKSESLMSISLATELVEWYHEAPVFPRDQSSAVNGSHRTVPIDPVLDYLSVVFESGLLIHTLDGWQVLETAVLGEVVRAQVLLREYLSHEMDQTVDMLRTQDTAKHF